MQSEHDEEESSITEEQNENRAESSSPLEECLCDENEENEDNDENVENDDNGENDENEVN